MTRRRWLGGLALGAASGALATSSWACSRRRGSETLRVALLHLNPTVGALADNATAVVQALRVAADAGAQWAVTSELALTGYYFERAIGADWIERGPDAHVVRLQAEAADRGMALFVGHVERSAAGDCHNALFVTDRDGTPVGVHHKINTISGAEDWSAPGTAPLIVALDGLRVGLLICADAWPAEHALALAQRGADLLVSAATWPPGQYGPGDTWERRSAETGLPLFVANRTGVEGDFDMRRGTSVLASGGRRLFEHASPRSFVAVLDWDHRARQLRGQQVVALDV